MDKIQELEEKITKLTSDVTNLNAALDEQRKVNKALYEQTVNLASWVLDTTGYKAKSITGKTQFFLQHNDLHKKINQV